MFPIKEDIQIFNFQELDVNVKERVDYREMGMMRPERVGGWGGEVTREGGDYLREVIYLKLSCKLGTLVSGERERDFTVGVTIIQENITSLFFFNNIHRCLSC